MKKEKKIVFIYSKDNNTFMFNYRLLVNLKNPYASEIILENYDTDIDVEKLILDCLELVNTTVFYFIENKHYSLIQKHILQSTFSNFKFANLVLDYKDYNLAEKNYYEDFIFGNLIFEKDSLKSSLKSATCRQDFSLLRDFVVKTYKYCWKCLAIEISNGSVCS